MTIGFMDQKRRKRPRAANSPIAFGFLLLVTGLVVSWQWCRLPEEVSQMTQETFAPPPVRKNVRTNPRRVAAARQEANRHWNEPPQTGDEDEDVGASAAGGLGDAGRLAEGERLAEEFYRETDRWIRGDPVSVDDVQRFVRKFSAVPESRKGACLHRALNLIPDVNVALLAGILLDPSQPKAIVKEVFDDVVNRSEEVKVPILEAVCQDKSHPCCDDATWIFEVTGEVPK